MKIRKLRLLAVPVAAAVMMLSGMSPADAAGSGAVTGTVNSSPGVPLAPLVTTTSNVSFSSTAILGTIEVGVCVYAGTINVTASATATDTNAYGSGPITALNGSGTTGPVSITVALAAPTLVVATLPTVGNVGENTFVRVGTHVGVVLGLRVTITGPTGSCTARVTAVVEAEFIPTTTNGTHITGALFVGSFSTAP
ncbi:MAG TPA: hypothetical protein VM938_01270 [Acidimicrobiales bacterium]|nr:hypothetical protein [Acidimicrobiales bacterium]